MSNELKQELIEKVIEQIILDLAYREVEAIEELLGFCPVENLIGYLSEEEGNKFGSLLK